MNTSPDDRLDQLLRNWLSESKPDSQQQAALKARIVDACRHEASAKDSADGQEPLPIASEPVGAMDGKADRRRSSRTRLPIAVMAAASAAVLLLGVGLTFWIVRDHREVARQEPGAASGGAVIDRAVDEAIADSQSPHGTREAGPSEPSPSDAGPAAEVLPPPAIEAENEEHETDGTPRSVAADAAEKPSKRLHDGFAEQADADSAEQMPRPAIHQAASRGDLAELRKILKRDSSLVRISDSKGATALHVAASSGAKEIAELLIAHGADVNVADGRGRTPLLQAVTAGHRELVRLLISADAHVKGSDALFAAASNDRREIAKLLIDAGADPNAEDSQGHTPLDHWRTSTTADRQMAQLLIEHGARPTLPTYVALDDVAHVRELLASVNDINAVDSSGETLLCTAVIHGAVRALELLIAEGADINAKDRYGNTMLHVAAMRGRLAAAEFLIAHGADVNALGRNQQTPLHVAAGGENVAMVRLLIDKGAKATATMKRGVTPLHYSLIWGKRRVDIVQALVAAGADVNARTDSGVTPLHTAAMYGKKDIVALLLAEGAAVNARTDEGRTPLDLANQGPPVIDGDPVRDRSGHRETADLLREHGGQPGTGEESREPEAAEEESEAEGARGQSFDVL